MLQALETWDQNVSRSAAEFFSGYVSIEPAENESWSLLLPRLLPSLLRCCYFTSADQMNTM